MKRYEILLLDADNTLFDFDRSEREALGEMFAQYGYVFTPEMEAVYANINKPLWDAFDRGEISREFLGPERYRRFQLEVDGCVTHDPQEMHDQYQLALSTRPYLLPGAWEVCEELSRHYPLYIVTNGMEVAQRRITNGPASRFFSGVFISQTMGSQKPSRAYFDKVFDALGLTEADRQRVLLIGDNPVSDIKGGQDYGLDTVWFCRGDEPLPEDVNPTYIIHRLTELLFLLLPEEEAIPFGDDPSI